MNHTPGPWRYDAQNHQIRTGEPTERRFSGELIATVSPLNPEMQGNARLIAVAPETLKVLENLLAYLREFWPLEPLFSTYDDRQAVEIHDAESVIRKARGEQ